MKVVIVVALALVAVAAAAPLEDYPKIIKSDFTQEPAGGYQFGFETENGINRSEQGELASFVDEENKPHEVVVVRGSYTYVDEDGKTETVNYFADNTGFHAEGNSIPKPARR